ncbi:hypothetical protein E4U19_002456 [Claviceps sp. Clav32 group G5]|nr:hypothetical protein E4U19_002456 [Claviceps sp. Clav32 group G5]KAG6046633.1 hypothetical protein E4U39_001183 [Claviceps sp. Clav50 group G5]
MHFHLIDFKTYFLNSPHISTLAYLPTGCETGASDLGVVILLTELKARHTPIVIADGDDFEFTMDAVGEHWSLYGTCHHIDAMRPEVREMVQKTRRNTPARRQEDNPASALPVHDRNPFDTEGFM